MPGFRDAAVKLKILGGFSAVVAALGGLSLFALLGAETSPSTWIVAALLVLGSLAVGHYLASSISEPMSRATELATKAAAGDFGDQYELDQTDEIGTLVTSLGEVTQAVQRVVAEVGRVTRQVEGGDLTARGSVASFSGAYAEIISSTNSLVHLLEEGIARANQESDQAQRFFGDLSTAIEAVASRDLAAKMTGDYRGEFGQVKDAFDIAIGTLDEALSEVGEVADQVAAAADQINEGSEWLAESSSEQASSLEQVSSSLQELRSMTEQNATNAQEGHAVAEKAGEATANGMDAMRDLSAAIERIKSSSDETAKIVKTIDEIAFQTNLLALNAAVEAARAGDAGAGFAVVADEVRNLAMRSAQAAKDTTELIEGSAEIAEHGVQINQQVVEHLAAIQTAVMQTREVVAEISTASERQTRGLQEITTAVEEMNGVTQTAAANSEESASASGELKDQAQRVRDLVASFKLTKRATPSSGSSPRRKPRRHAPAPSTGVVDTATGHGSGNGHNRIANDLIPFDDDSVMGQF